MARDKYSERPPYYITGDGRVLVKNSVATGMDYLRYHNLLKKISRGVKRFYKNMPKQERQRLAKAKAAYRKDPAKAAYCNQAGADAWKQPGHRAKHRQGMIEHHRNRRTQAIIAALQHGGGPAARAQAYHMAKEPWERQYEEKKRRKAQKRTLNH